MPLPKPLFHMLLASDEESCRDLVKTLVEKSGRLRREATDPKLIKSVTRKITSVPGLSVVGETVDDPSLKTISDEALATVNQFMNDQRTMNDSLKSQSQVINNLLKQGAKTGEELVDELLGLKPMLPPMPNMASRELSYTKYPDDATPHLVMGRHLMQEELKTLNLQVRRVTDHRKKNKREKQACWRGP